MATQIRRTQHDIWVCLNFVIRTCLIHGNLIITVSSCVRNFAQTAHRIILSMNCEKRYLNRQNGIRRAGVAVIGSLSRIPPSWTLYFSVEGTLALRNICAHSFDTYLSNSCKYLTLRTRSRSILGFFDICSTCLKVGFSRYCP